MFLNVQSEFSFVPEKVQSHALQYALNAATKQGSPIGKPIGYPGNRKHILNSIKRVNSGVQTDKLLYVLQVLTFNLKFCERQTFAIHTTEYSFD